MGARLLGDSGRPDGEVLLNDSGDVLEMENDSLTNRLGFRKEATSGRSSMPWSELGHRRLGACFMD